MMRIVFMKMAQKTPDITNKAVLKPMKAYSISEIANRKRRADQKTGMSTPAVALGMVRAIKKMIPSKKLRIATPFSGAFTCRLYTEYTTATDTSVKNDCTPLQACSIPNCCILGTFKTVPDMW